MIIFALTLTVLLGLAGLSIDVARAYDLYARMQRTAESGVLAGVLYMPNYYAIQRPSDTESGISRASKEMAKNGFGTALPITTTQAQACATTNEIAICPVLNKSTDLRVTITEQLSLVLLGGLGVTPITLQVSAQASYLPVLQIGSRTNSSGNQVECPNGSALNFNSGPCDPNSTSQQHLQYYMNSINGPATLKESGDPYVYCAEGPATIPNGTALAPDPDNGDSFQTYNGLATNHAQQPGVVVGSNISQYCGKTVVGGKVGNPDYQPSGYYGEATAGVTDHQGGYNFYMSVGTPVSAASLWVFNPYYIPRDNPTDCTSPLPFDHFMDDTPSPTACPITHTFSPSAYIGQNGEGIGATFDGIHHDAPLFYFTTTFSLYSVSSTYDRGADTLVGSWALRPYDATSADLALHGCSSGQVYDPQYSGSNTPNFYYKAFQITRGAGCVAPPRCQTGYTTWCPFGVLTDSTTGGTDTGTSPTLTSGVYRIVAETTGITARVVDDVTGKKYYLSGPTDGWGHHTFAIKACDNVAGAFPAYSPFGSNGCKDGSTANGAGNQPQIFVNGWNNMNTTFQYALDVRTPNVNFPQSACVTGNANPYACVDLVCIPTEFAGRSITISLFDVGSGANNPLDGLGTYSVGLSPPPRSGYTVGANLLTSNYPNTPSTVDGVYVIPVRDTSGYRPFNGLWFDVTLTLPSNYQGDCASSTKLTGGTGWWQLVYVSTSTQRIPREQFATKFTTVGSPVHLTPVADG